MAPGRFRINQKNYFFLALAAFFFAGFFAAFFFAAFFAVFFLAKASLLKKINVYKTTPRTGIHRHIKKTESVLSHFIQSSYIT